MAGLRPNYYYSDPQVGATAANLGLAIFGDQSQAAQNDYYRARTRHSDAETGLLNTRQAGLDESAAMWQDVATTVDPATGVRRPATPDELALRLPRALSHAERTFQVPGGVDSMLRNIYAIGAAGGSDTMGRAAIIAHGGTPGAAFAVTPQRADAISARDAAETLRQASTVAGISAGASITRERMQQEGLNQRFHLNLGPDATAFVPPNSPIAGAGELPPGAADGAPRILRGTARPQTMTQAQADAARSYIEAAPNPEERTRRQREVAIPSVANTETRVLAQREIAQLVQEGRVTAADAQAAARVEAARIAGDSRVDAADIAAAARVEAARTRAAGTASAFRMSAPDLRQRDDLIAQRLGLDNGGPAFQQALAQLTPAEAAEFERITGESYNNTRNIDAAATAGHQYLARIFERGDSSLNPFSARSLRRRATPSEAAAPTAAQPYPRAGVAAPAAEPPPIVQPGPALPNPFGASAQPAPVDPTAGLVAPRATPPAAVPAGPENRVRTTGRIENDEEWNTALTEARTVLQSAVDRGPNAVAGIRAEVIRRLRAAGGRRQIPADILGRAR